MSEYYVDVVTKDDSTLRIEFDSFNNFHTYLDTIDHKLHNYVPNSDAFIDIGNKEMCLVPIQEIKMIHSHGYVLKDSKK